MSDKTTQAPKSASGLRNKIIVAFAVAGMGVLATYATDIIRLLSPIYFEEQWCVDVTPGVDNEHTMCHKEESNCEKYRGFLLFRKESGKSGFVSECRKKEVRLNL